MVRKRARERRSADMDKVASVQTAIASSATFYGGTYAAGVGLAVLIQKYTVSFVPTWNETFTFTDFETGAVGAFFALLLTAFAKLLGFSKKPTATEEVVVQPLEK